MIKFTQLAVIAFVTVFALQVSAAFQCTEKKSRHPIEGQCDAYIECIDGNPVEKLCPDGLLFREDVRACVYGPSTLCGNRAKLQPPQGTGDCPRLFGFYRIGDNSHCGQYLNCAHGIATRTKCPEGLAFNKETYRCDWPDETPDCDSEAYLGFTCPSRDLSLDGELGEDRDGLQYYPYPDDCKHYFVCVNGKPRLYKCSKYLVFNPNTKLCDFYSNVPGCELKHEKEYKEVLAIERLREIQRENEEALLKQEALYTEAGRKAAKNAASDIEE